MRVVIDPGHGGHDRAGGSSPFGARGVAGTLEKDVTLDLARRVAARIGPAATLTRDGDYNLPLATRISRARQAGASVFLSLHANDGAPGSRGSETWVHPRAPTRSRTLAVALSSELARLGGPQSPRPLEGEIALLAPEWHAPETAACLIEVDYLTDPDGERRLRDPGAVEALAEAIVRAIRRFVGTSPAEKGAVETIDRALEIVEFNQGDPLPVDTPPYTEWVQRSLNRILNLNLAVDGEAGPSTSGAVRQFQQQNNITPVNGTVGPDTEAALIAAGADAAPTMPAITAVGIDYNADLRPLLSCLRTAQWRGQTMSFAVRYYGNHGPPHDVAPLEARAASENGIQCVAVWESNPGGIDLTYFTRARGDGDGYTASAKARRIGQPSGRPIYFAIDNVDPLTSDDRALVEEYFEGVRAGMARALAEPEGQAAGVSYPVGVYGSWNTLDWCRDQGIVTWFWQSCSTGTSRRKSRYLWPGANLRQVKCEHRLCGVSVDINEAYSDFGGWLLPVAPWVDFPSVPQPEHPSAPPLVSAAATRSFSGS
jgi:peptidoglycan hydrolase-like protein with peptidoglycan-binding domain